MTGEGGLTRSAFLAGEDDDVHVFLPSGLGCRAYRLIGNNMSRLKKWMGALGRTKAMLQEPHPSRVFIGVRIPTGGVGGLASVVGGLASALLNAVDDISM